MAGYIGTQPVPQATQTRDAFTCTAGQTSFATSGYTPGFLDVYLNGIKLAAADYTASNGSDVVLASGAALDDILEVVAYTSFEVVTDTVTNAGTVLNLDRTGSDGTILDLKKDGTTVGSIGAYANEYYHGSAVGGDTFLRHGWSGIVPATSSGTNRDAAIQLGSSVSRFKDLYLSGGVYLGGTGASNQLDDYEEGTWTPTVNGIYGNVPSGGASSTSGQYTKIGRLVTVQFTIDFANSGASAALDDRMTIGGLPFVGQDFFNGAGQAFQYGQISTGNNAVWTVIATSSSAFWMYLTHEDGSVQYDEVIRGSMTYRAA